MREAILVRGKSKSRGPEAGMGAGAEWGVEGGAVGDEGEMAAAAESCKVPGATRSSRQKRSDSNAFSPVVQPLVSPKTSQGPFACE